jgi:GPH family glycoside/pentoside/hexuronide:cation symporter
MPPPASKRPITARIRHGHGFGSYAYGVSDLGFSNLLLLFCNQVRHLPASRVGLAPLIVLMADACLDPIIGQWSDTLHSRWGRRHPFMYASALPVALGYLLLWDPPASLSGTALFYYLIAVAILVRFSLSLYEISSLALAPELTENYHGRTALLAYRIDRQTHDGNLELLAANALAAEPKT